MIKLKEIYGTPLPPKNAGEFIKQQTANTPIYSDSEQAKKSIKIALLEVSKAVKAFIQYLIVKDTDRQGRSISFVLDKLADLHKICTVWSSNLTIDNPAAFPEIKQRFLVIEGHLNELNNQLSTAAESIETYGHFINAQNEMRHWFEILAATNRDLNDFFDFLKSKEIQIK
jgi:hypothetical protein